MFPSAATNRAGSPVYELSTWLLLSSPLPSSTSTYGAPEKTSTVAPLLPMSSTLEKLQSDLPQKKICGFFSYQAKTARVGWLADEPICSSVPIMPSRMLSSWYIWAVTSWKPIAGPPARISTLTPVVPSGPEYVFLFVSIVPLGPISWYRKPWSGSGHQLVWKTTVSGQMPFKLLAAAGAAPATALGDGTTEAAATADGDAAGLAAGEAAGETAGDAAGEVAAAGEAVTAAVVGFGAAAGAVVGAGAGAAGPPPATSIAATTPASVEPNQREQCIWRNPRGEMNWDPSVIRPSGATRARSQPAACLASRSPRTPPGQARTTDQRPQTAGPIGAERDSRRSADRCPARPGERRSRPQWPQPPTTPRQTARLPRWPAGRQP